jgi:hypothetical protein
MLSITLTPTVQSIQVEKEVNLLINDIVVQSQHSINDDQIDIQNILLNGPNNFFKFYIFLSLIHFLFLILTFSKFSLQNLFISIFYGIFWPLIYIQFFNEILDILGISPDKIVEEIFEKITYLFSNLIFFCFNFLKAALQLLIESPIKFLGALIYIPLNLIGIIFTFISILFHTIGMKFIGYVLEMIGFAFNLLSVLIYNIFNHRNDQQSIIKSIIDDFSNSFYLTLNYYLIS